MVFWSLTMTTTPLGHDMIQLVLGCVCVTIGPMNAMIFFQKGKLYSIMEISFDQIFKEHLDDVRPVGDKIYNFFDPICCEYIGYIEHITKMEEIGAGSIEKLGIQTSLGCLLGALGKESDEPLHLIPSASLMVNHAHSRDFGEAHGIHQWWKPDLCLESKLYQY